MPQQHCLLFLQQLNKKPVKQIRPTITLQGEFAFIFRKSIFASPFFRFTEYVYAKNQMLIKLLGNLDIELPPHLQLLQIF